MDKSEKAAAIFNELAHGYQEKYMDVSLYHPTLDIFCNSIENNSAEILELACGPGNITQYLLNKKPEYHILGTDLAPQMLELAKLNNPKATFELMDCRQIVQLNKQYDAIMCGFCLPYLSKEVAIQLIHDAAKILIPKGVIYISTMEGYYSNSTYHTSKSNPGKSMFINYHEQAYLIQALISNGLNILEKKQIKYQGADGNEVIDLVLIAQKS